PKSDLNGNTHGDDEGNRYSAAVDEMMLDEVSHGEIDKEISEFPAGETVDQSDLTAFRTLQQKDPRSHDELPFKLAESTCHEEVPVGRKVQQEVNGN
ncbi:hypothetical protein ACTGWK_12085, partial [Streptococcus suis]